MLCIGWAWTTVACGQAPDTQPAPGSTGPLDLTTTQHTPDDQMRLAVTGNDVAPSDREVIQGPVRALAWHRVSESSRFITTMIWVTPETDPRRVAEMSRSKPTGQAALIAHRLMADIFWHPKDKCQTPDGRLTSFRSPWPKHGSERVKKRVLDFMTAYANAGGRLDVFVLDFEQNLSNWALTPEHLKAIESDPRSERLKARLGFDDFSTVKKFRQSDDYLRWNAVLHEHVCRVLNQAVFNPVKQLYPQSKSNNYGSYRLTPANVVPDSNGHRQYRLAHCGTHGTASFYGRISHLAGRKLDGRRPYGRSPFAVLRWHLNAVRAIRRSSDVPFMPWISHKYYKPSALRDNPYYEELIYHLALSGVDGFLYWNPHRPKNRSSRGHAKPLRKPQKQEGIVYSDEAQDRLLDQCLIEINSQLGVIPGVGPGVGPRWCVTLAPIDWDSSLLATGIRIGADRLLWRITVPPDVRRVHVMPGDQTLVIPDAQVGVWYESTPTDNPSFKTVE